MNSYARLGFCTSISIAAHCCLLVGGSIGTEQSPASVARFCLDGFEAGRDAAQSAEVRVEETSGSSDKAGSPRHYLLAFDRTSGSSRFDSDADQRQISTIRLRDREFLFVRPPGRAVNMYNPGAMPDIAGGRAFDLQALGIVTLSEFEHRLSWRETRTLLSSGTVKEATEEPNGRYRVVWEYALRPSGKAERAIWFDKNQGFAPVRAEVTVLEVGQKRLPLEWVVTDWTHVDSVWLPIKCEMHRN